MKFTKMEALGNDFVVTEGIDPDPDLVQRLCDRRRGIGADGLLVVDDFPTMRYWNADGSAAQMCGNGLRCVALYAVMRGWEKEKEWFSIVTPVEEEGPLVASDPAFPEGTNVEFVAVENERRIRMRVWERGVGETLACGSGMVAATAVAVGQRTEPVTVVVPGGVGQVFFDQGDAFLVGPAVAVFWGEWPQISAAS